MLAGVTVTLDSKNLSVITELPHLSCTTSLNYIDSLRGSGDPLPLFNLTICFSRSYRDWRTMERTLEVKFVLQRVSLVNLDEIGLWIMDLHQSVPAALHRPGEKNFDVQLYADVVARLLSRIVDEIPKLYGPAKELAREQYRAAA